MDTNPETEVTGDAVAEAQLEALFSKGIQDEPPPEDEQPAEAETEEVGDDQPEEPTEEELADLEVDGRILKLPKTAAEKLKAERLMQADYTRKTQELAERNRLAELQEQRLQLHQQAQGVLGQKQAEVIGLHQQLQQYDQINWTALTADQAYPLIAKRDELRSAAEKARSELEQMGQQFAQQTRQSEEQYRQKLTELGLARLNEEMGGWTQDKQDATAKYLQSAGYTAQEMQGLLAYDPRFMRMAYEAQQYRNLQATKAQTIEKKVSAAKPFTQPASRGVQKSQADSKALDLRDRMKKSGRPEDVAAFLAASFSKRK